MTPDDIGPATARLLMLTAAGDDPPAIEAAMNVFDDRTSQRILIASLLGNVLERFPYGAPLVLQDADDVNALEIVDIVAGDPAIAPELIDSLDDDEVPGLAISLLAFWHQACARAAQIALSRLTIPEHAPQEP